MITSINGSVFRFDLYGTVFCTLMFFLYWTVLYIRGIFFVIEMFFAGLLDETVRIRSTAAKFPATIFKSEDRQTQQPLSETIEMKKIFLSSADPMYIEVSRHQGT